uniref:Transposable element Tcb1 transposase n=1 Tax=Bactrocera dorsalis TaxID=27457 RepID=A0A034VZC2_BACDO
MKAGLNEVGNLTFIEETMNKHVHLKVLQENLLQSARKLQTEDDFRFYQDNDPKCKSHIVQTWLIYKCPHIVETPAQSTDLNAIENLWSILKTNIKKHDVLNKSDLKKL